MRRLPARRGTTAVEVALVLPLFLVCLFAMFEIGHAMMISYMVKSATRNAARLGIIEGTTTDEVDARLRDYLESTLDTTEVSVMIKDATTIEDTGELPESSEEYDELADLELSGAERRQLFLVRATVNYNDVALVPLGFMDGVQFVGQSLSRHE